VSAAGTTDLSADAEWARQLAGERDPLEHAGPAPGRRAVAFILDPVILLLVMMTLVEIGNTAMQSATEAAWRHVEDPRAPIPSVNLPLIYTLLATAFLLPVVVTLVEAFTGKTPAKFMMGLRVLGRDDRPAGRGRMLARWATKSSWLLIGTVAFGLEILQLPGVEWLMLLSFCAWVVALIGCVPGLAGRTTLHDFVAKTQVVKRGDRGRNARFVQASSDDPVAAS